jgi:NADPH-dependent 2,4-dienoyl-CoA reductase/sulfur reductase-like enzyme
MDDSVALRERLVEGISVVVIGGGFIGSEVASTAHSLGCRVTVIEALPVPYERVLGAEMGRQCASLHERNGVPLLCGVGVEAIDEGSVRLTDGRVIVADVVVAGIGVSPATAWLDDSGIHVDNGVQCDESLRALMVDGSTSESVWAVGDIASWPNALFPLGDSAPERMRVEHWTTAAEMGEFVGQQIAATLGDLSADRGEAFTTIPYFWSDQYGSKIQFIGRATHADEVRVVEGPDDQGRLLALYRRGDRLSGVLGISRMKALMGYRAHLANQALWADVL